MDADVKITKIQQTEIVKIINKEVRDEESN